MNAGPVPAESPDPAVPGMPGRHERHVARGALLQQVSQVWGTLCMLLVATVLGRTLTLSEFGLYGLLIALVAWLVTLQISVEGAAVRAIASSRDDRQRAVTFATTLAVYAVGGILAGVLLATVGVALVGLLGVPAGLRHEARLAVLGLAAVTAVGWPFKAFQDVLRATQMFGLAAVGEMAAYATVAAGAVVLTAAGAPLWAIVTVSGSLSVLIGAWCMVVLRVMRVGVRFRRANVSVVEARRILNVSSSLFAAGLADLIIYSLDRVVLGAYRPAATIGLYEGAARPHNLLRQLQGTLLLTVVPVASDYLAAGDQERVRDLLLRGSRYVLVVVAPVAVVLVVLASPLLEVWLGPRFHPAALSLALLCGYWIVGANTGVVASMLLAAGRVRILARYAWLVAGANLALSLALTPWLGLEGVVLGTVIPNVVSLPAFLYVALREFPVTRADMVREVWIPGYTACLVAVIVLLPLRLSVDLASLPALILATVAALAAAWASFWFGFMTDGERRLARALARSPLSPG